MTRIGAYCIDNERRPVDTWWTAVNTCHLEQRIVCPVAAYGVCDSVSPEGTTCDAALNDPEAILWSSDIEEGSNWAITVWESASHANDFLGECARSKTHDYYCCQFP